MWRGGARCGEVRRGAESVRCGTARRVAIRCRGVVARRGAARRLPAARAGHGSGAAVRVRPHWQPECATRARCGCGAPRRGARAIK
jgi:hypothetical protein